MRRSQNNAVSFSSALPLKTQMRGWRMARLLPFLKMDAVCIFNSRIFWICMTYPV
ncbi:hypothetical protein G3Z74_004084 [Escherichia coli]|nr:hypothetical protein [Escherichia coli]EFI8989222.1 hypothetical protein [Escherichia coli]